MTGNPIFATIPSQKTIQYTMILSSPYISPAVRSGIRAIYTKKVSKKDCKLIDKFLRDCQDPQGKIYDTFFAIHQLCPVKVNKIKSELIRIFNYEGQTKVREASSREFSIILRTEERALGAFALLEAAKLGKVLHPEDYFKNRPFLIEEIKKSMEKHRSVDFETIPLNR